MGWIADKLAGLRYLFAAGLPLPQRQGLNFSAEFVLTDNPALKRTDVTVGAGGAAPFYTGHTEPTELGTFGVSPITFGVGYDEWANGPRWVERAGMTRVAARREYLVGVEDNPGVQLADGMVVVSLGTFAGGTVTLPNGDPPVPHPAQIGEGWHALIDATAALGPITVVCPPGHSIGGQPVDTDYDVPAGAMVSIRSSSTQMRWAILAWTV